MLKLTDLSGYRIRDKIVFSSLVKSVTSVIRLKNEQILYKNCLIHGSVTDQEKDVSFFLDETGEPVAQQRDPSRQYKLTSNQPKFH